MWAARFTTVVLAVVVSVWTVMAPCEVCATLNSGVIPQAFFDFMQQQQQQRQSTNTNSPVKPPPPPQPPAAMPPSSPPPVTNRPPEPEVAPSLTSSEPRAPPVQPARGSDPLPPPPETSPAAPSAEQLMRHRETILQQQQELQRLQRQLQQQLQQQQLLRLQLQAQATSPPPTTPKPPAPKADPPRVPPSFLAPNYEFVPLAQAAAPPPSPPPKPALATTQDGVIDFVPAEHKRTYAPVRHSVVGTMARDWVARQVPPPPLTRPSPPPTAFHPPLPPPPLHRAGVPPPPRPAFPRSSAPASIFSSLPLPREFQTQAMNMGRKMCVTQFYESHGCIDPVRYLPPGSTSQGLAMSCSSPASRQLCHVAGSRVPGVRSPGGAAGSNKLAMMMMMMQGSASKELLERCLTPKTVTRAMTDMMKGRGSPTTMMMMMGGEGGGGGLAALAMMNMMKGRGGGGGGGGPGIGSLPPGAASPLSSSPAPNGAGGAKCDSVLSLVLSQGVDGGFMSPEMVNAVSNMRKKMLPYTCQEVNHGVYFRMCCPGKVPAPTMMEMMTHCG